MTSSISMMDVTLRDGGFLFNQNYPVDTFQDVATCLDHSGIPYIEVGHGLSVGAKEKGIFAEGRPDAFYAQTAREAVKKARLGMVAHVDYATPAQLERLRPYLDFVRIGTNADNPDAAESLIRHALDLRYQVFYQMIRTSRVSPQTAAATAEKAESFGAEVIYLVDSGGLWSPWMLAACFETVRRRVKTPLGIHTHNHLGVALANALEAVRLGCLWADGSLRGIGKGGGNAQTELLNIHLKRMGHETGVDPAVLELAGRRLSEDVPLGERGIAQEDYLPASVGIDIHPVTVMLAICREAGIDLPTFVGALARIPNLIEVSRADIEAALQSLGVDPVSTLHKAGL